MSEKLPSIDETFEDALRVLAHAGESAVAIGGWAVRLLRRHELAREPPHAPLFTTDLDVALAANDAELGDQLHERLESAGFARRLEGSEEPPVSAHVRETDSGPVKVEFLMKRMGGPTSRTGKSTMTRDLGGLTAQCFPSIRLLLLEPWLIRLPVSSREHDSESVIDLRVPNPTSLLLEKLLIIETRRTVGDQAKDVLYIAELLGMFADGLDELVGLACRVVRPELTKKEIRTITNRIANLTATSDMVLAAAVEAGSTGRTQWEDPSALAALLEDGLSALMAI